MKKFLLFLLPLCLFAEKSPPWHRADARFRMEFQREVPEEAVFVDFSRIVIPDDLRNGLIITDFQGKTVLYHQYDREKAVILPSGTDAFLCYFGFEKRQGRRQLDRRKYTIPPEYRLRQANRSVHTVRNPALWKELNRGPMSRISQITRKAPEYISPWYLALVQNAVSTSRSGKPVLPKETEPAGQKLKFFTDAVSERMKENLFRIFGRHQGRNAAAVFFHRRPYDTERGFAALFHGRFYAPETGIYCFRAHSNSTRILRIDDKERLGSFGEFASLSAESVGSLETVEIPLKKGTHRFEFAYAKGLIGERAGVFWKRKGETAFRLLTENEFMPAPPPKIRKICGKDGTLYPLMERTGLWDYYVGKQEKGTLEQICFLEEPEKGHWSLNGIDWGPEYRIFALPEKSSLQWIPEGKGGTVTVRPKKSGAARIPVIPRGPMTFYGPHMLFDDEYTDLTVCCSASFPFAARTRFRVLPEKPGVFFQRTEEPLLFPPVLPEEENKYLSGAVEKRYFRIDGKRFQSSETVTFDLLFPGLPLDSMKLRILRPEELAPPLVCTPEGLKDRDGNRLLVLLHRKTLHEVRKWELTEKAVDTFRKKEKVLVIGPEFGSFRTTFESKAAENGMKLRFIPWSSSPVPGGSRVLNTFSKIMEELQNCTADTALILPPSAPERGILGNREEINFLACLLELLEKRNIRAVLAAPLPFDASDGGDESGFTADLRNLRREKGIEFIETEPLLKKLPQWGENVFHQNGIRFTRPVGLAEKAAELLFREL